MYYRSVNDLSNTFCVEPTRNEYRELNGAAQVISIPGLLLGDKIQETTEFQSSIKINSGTLEIRDDGNGNLYDVSAGGFSDPLGTYRSMTGSLVFHVNFNEKFPYHKDNIGAHCPAFTDILEDRSRYGTDTRGNTMFFNTGSQTAHGTGVMLTGTKGANIYDDTRWSYFKAKKHQNIDFRKDEDFAVSLWCNLPSSQSDDTNLFNYIVTSGQGDHFDKEAQSPWSSKFPFDIVTYNHRTNPTDHQSLLPFNQLRPATGSIRIANASTGSEGSPSQSQHMTLTDALGTTVRFCITTASIANSQATYPSISLAGARTASAGLIASTVSERINQGIIYGYTQSGNPFPLLISSSAQILSHPTYGAQLNFSSSIRGVAGNRDASKLVGAAGSDSQATSNTFNLHGQANFQGGSGSFSLASMYTSSYFIATSYGPTGGSNVSVPISETESYERHVFYWYSASNVPPQLGAFTTHSTTGIPLNETTDFSSGSHDVLSIASKSMQVIDSHPSFSYTPTQGDTNALTRKRYIGIARRTTAGPSQDTLGKSLAAILGESFSFPAGADNTSFQHFRDSNPGNPPDGSTIVSGSTTGIHQNTGVGGLVLSQTAGAVSADGPIAQYSHVSQGTRGYPGQILARRNDGTNLFEISSSTAVTESWNHVLYQKTGSKLQLYINSNLECEIQAKDEGQCKNKDDIFFGVATRQTWSGDYVRNDAGDIFINSNGQPKKEMVQEFMRPLSGALDEIRIFDKSLNSDQIQFLYNCPNGTPYVGNAFYEHGLLTVTHPSTSYAGISKHCTMSFRNSYQITEHEYTLNVKKGEYNFTMNPSIIEKSATGSRLSQIASYVTETDWDPYISTVGLYNDAGQLLVVGKLSRALRKEDGYDTTLVVRYDT